MTDESRALRILLLSTYELGHQPLWLARPAAHLLAAGHAVSCQDLSVEQLDEGAVRSAELIGISVPMHTATRLGSRLSERIRSLNPDAHVCFYGLYASLNSESLLGPADSVIGGEVEGPLVQLAASLTGGDTTAPISGVIGYDGGGVFLGRQQFALPNRELLPPLDRYARLDDGESLKLAGYVEASRGCAHRCLHCPITPVYGGRVRIVQREVVLEDIRQLVGMGAQHITFGDPDFFNGVKHSIRIVQDLHSEFPTLTYDATIKIEHLIEHQTLLPFLKKTGCLFVVSAVESIDDCTLGYLEKGHQLADIEIALGLMAEAGLVLRPTFVAFTPWIDLEGYLNLLEFVERHGLVRNVDSVQYAIRLLVPRGSSLIGSRALAGRLGAFDPHSLSHTWQHFDPRVDTLQTAIAGVVEQAATLGEDASATFGLVKRLALKALGRVDVGVPVASLPDGAAHVPRLTEPWFC